MAAARRPERLVAIIVGLVLSAAVIEACSDDDGRSATTAPGEDAAVAVEAMPVLDVVDTDTSAPLERGRDRLSRTGLYTNIGTKALAADALEFEPDFVLWSDGATKRRWIRLPANTTIDTTDPDHWVFPVGTQLFKEFALDGKRLETRLVERIGATGKDEADYWMGSFVWRDDESDADFVAPGAQNVRQTQHDVPSARMCWSCHIGEPGHVLGFSALQLSHDKGGLNLAGLRTRGLVAPTVVDGPLVGPRGARDAVGWLHANCGHCHNINGSSWPDTDMVLRSTYNAPSIEGSAVYRSTVGVPTRSYKTLALRIAPGDPDASAVAHRPSVRGDSGAMPPVATEIIDHVGLDLVRSWISSLR